MTHRQRWHWIFLLLMFTAAMPTVAQEVEQPAGQAPQPRSLLGESQQHAAERAVVGQWVASIGDVSLALLLNADRTFQFDGRSGVWRIDGASMVLTDSTGQTSSYTYKIEGGALTLSGGDLPAGPVVFIRHTPIAGFFMWLFDISWESILRSIGRLAVVIMIVLIIRLVLELVKHISHMIFFSNRGPMRLLYRRHKSRAMTIHSLVLNFIKYAVYLTALGYVLRELGVNYTTYLASLSVIALAIGFGSQGLVQDTVTGFFIIFEGQFDVGDMVEISGQTGIVEELGLRMTKLRNYVGQVVIIPNRNIAVVGNFARGALVANVEVAIPSLEVADKASIMLRRVGEQLRRQLDGAILRPPRIGEPLSLNADEHFVRMHIAIWPGQQWVVDQQLVPRIREAFSRAELAIPADRVVTHYFPREYYKPTNWRSTLVSLGRRGREHAQEKEHPPEPEAGESS